jgi:RNA polymerase sigma-B factor
MTAPTEMGPLTNSRERRHAETNRLLRRAAEVTDAAERRRLIDQAVLLNLEVARTVARRFRNRGVSDDDLEQIAGLALVRAAYRFEPGKAEDFLTFAIPTIRGELKRYFRDHAWAVRPPRRVQEVQAALLGSGLDLSLGAEELAKRLDLPLGDVREGLGARGCFSPRSLDAPPPDHRPGTSLDQLVAPDDALEAVEARLILRTLTRELEPRERLILYLRFVEDRTQQEIGDEIGVTQMQVSRLLADILARMRTRLAAGPAGEVA